MLPRFTAGARAGTGRAFLLLLAIAFASACNDGDGVTGPPVPEVAGRVISSATGDGVAGAQVSIGDATVTTGPNGSYRLTGLAVGPATLRSVATGFDDFETDIVVLSGTTRRDVPLARIELFEFGDFTLHVPANASKARAVLVALGGPDTRGFASGAPFGAPFPPVEAALQALGEDVRILAEAHGLALLGTSLAAMPNGSASDQLILDALEEAVALSGRAELESAPLLLYGMSGGAPQASGFVARNPGRAAGLFLKAPAGMETLTGGEALGVPTYVVLAELDAFVDNAALKTTSMANRSNGAPWALAMERGVPHHSLSPNQRALTVNWMGAILALRLGVDWDDPLRAVVESAGWLGDLANGQVAAWATYAGNPRSASWFPSQATAEEWGAFVGAQAFASVP